LEPARQQADQVLLRHANNLGLLAILALRCEIPSPCEALKMVGFVEANAKIKILFVEIFPLPAGSA
jgi:hypothetical protein